MTVLIADVATVEGAEIAFSVTRLAAVPADGDAEVDARAQPRGTGRRLYAGDGRGCDDRRRRRSGRNVPGPTHRGRPAIGELAVRVGTAGEPPHGRGRNGSEHAGRLDLCLPVRLGLRLEADGQGLALLHYDGIA